MAIASATKRKPEVRRIAARSLYLDPELPADDVFYATLTPQIAPILQNCSRTSAISLNMPRRSRFPRN